jgi:polysaccharide chain length determinant protein (PEP-CTERM system associated)
MEQSDHFSLAPYFDIIYRHRLSSVCSLTVGLVLTFLATILVPSSYRSTTLVMIQPQEVPSEYVSAPVTGHIRDRLNALSQIALSRTRLEQIITQFGLYTDRRRHGASMDDVVEYMRRHIRIDILEDRNTSADSRAGSFTLSFGYSDATTAQRVTAKLADLFIDEDLRQRANQATATTAFLDEQLGKSNASLEAKEREIKVFKGRYQGSLPQDLAINLNMLGALQTQLQSDNEALAAAQEHHSQLERDLTRAREDRVTIVSASGQRSSASPEAAVAAKETELAELQAQNSDRHPDVVRVKAEIAGLKALIKRRAHGDTAETMSPEEMELSKEMERVDIDQRRLQIEIPSLKRKIDDYQQRITQTPTHEQQFAALVRDRDLLDTDYQKLKSKKLEAQISQNLEQRQEGERFQVLDPANYPLAPEAPDRGVLAIGGILLSIGVAGALPFVLFFTDSSFKDPDELRRELALPVAATIPEMKEIDNVVSRRRALYYSMAISCACFVVGVGVLLMYARTV